MVIDTVVIHRINGEVVETVIDGMKNVMTDYSIKQCLRYGTIIFDNKAETKAGYERITVYEYEYE